MASKKVCVITGSSAGIGAASAELFAQRGWDICINYSRELKPAEAVAARCESHGADVIVERADVADDAQVAAWAKKVLASHGAPDLLLNNAALINRSAPLWEVPAQEFSDVVDVNIKGTANVIRHFVPAMVQRGRGVIVNFSSGWGRSTDAEVAPYCATKWAIEGLTQSLAQELPSGMAAVPLNPGIINTDMLRSCFGGGATSYPSPEQWAKIAAPYILKMGPADNGRQKSVPGS